MVRWDFASELWRLQPCDAGLLAPGKTFWPRAIVWTAVLFGLTAVAFFASLQLPGWVTAFKSDDLACGLIIPAAMLVVYAVAVRLGELRPASELALTRAPLEIALGAVAGFAFIVLVLVLLWTQGFYEIGLGTWQRAWHYFVFNAYVSAVLEELAFRGILLRLFARMFGPLPALIISAALFGLAHVSHASPLVMLEIFLNGGLFLGLLYMVSGRLWLAIGAHVAYDFTEWSLMGVGDHDGLLVIRPAPGHPAWITGGTFGPDGSVLASFISLVLMVTILALSRHYATPGARAVN